MCRVVVVLMCQVGRCIAALHPRRDQAHHAVVNRPDGATGLGMLCCWRLHALKHGHGHAHAHDGRSGMAYCRFDHGTEGTICEYSAGFVGMMGEGGGDGAWREAKGLNSADEALIRRSRPEHSPC